MQSNQLLNLRSECLTSQAAQGNGERNSFRDSPQQQQHQQQQPFQQQRNPHRNFQRQHQRNHQANVSTAFWPRPCHECGSIEHLARNCPVRLTRPRSFCRFCNRVVFHTTEEHAGRNVNNNQNQTARNQRRGIIVIGANNTEISVIMIQLILNHQIQSVNQSVNHILFRSQLLLLDIGIEIEGITDILDQYR